MSLFSRLFRLGLIINKLKLIPPPIRNFLKKTKDTRLYSIRSKYFPELKEGISENVSIICNNCFGARISQDLKYPYNSPTVGLKFPQKDYQILLENLEFIKETEVKYREKSKYHWFDEYDQNYPIGYIEINGYDVEIWFVHYKSIEEANEKWKRRCQRINLEKLLIIETNYADTTEEDVSKFLRLPYEKLIYLSSKPLQVYDDKYFFVTELSKYPKMAPYAEAHILYKYLVKAKSIIK